jgi:hypothetical protein
VLKGVGMKTKICYKCQIEKNITDFASDKSKSDGFCCKCKSCYSEWYFATKKQRRKVAKRWYQENKIQERDKNKQRYLQNKERDGAKNRAWYQKNKESVRSYRAAYNKNKRKTDINFRLADSLRSRITKVLKQNKKSKHTMELIGCSIEQFRKHLEKQFVDGMSWDNYGFYGWHIDHIKPCSSFDLSNPEQQKLCFHYTNLQPLWAKDNLKKSDSIQ